uniref:DUF4760 domain-containing protein n=1 Tax=viral metagenome TaxID=1070528 RepID=A0A6C0DF14_9ZZZZ
MDYLKEIENFIKYNFSHNTGLVDILYYISYLLYISAFILLTKYYWKTKFGFDPKFQTYVQVLIAATIIITVYSVYFQIISYRDSVNNEEVQYFNNFYKEFLDETIKFFIDHPEMNYYYDELFYNKSDYDEKDRNKELEAQISIIIFSRMGSIIYYINAYKKTENDERRDKIEESEKLLLKILDSFFGSKIFNEYWSKFKNGLSNKVTIDYIKAHFNK